MPRLRSLLVLLATLAILAPTIDCRSKGHTAGPLGAPQPALTPGNPVYLVDNTNGASAHLLGTSDNPLVTSTASGLLGSALPALSPPNPVYAVDNTSGALAHLLGTADNPMVVTGTVAPGGAAGGDLSGTYPNPSVAKANGSTVPAGGSLTTGNVLQVSGAAALSYAAVNLAGGAGYVTGSLPAGNQAAQTCTGDVTGNTGATVVSAITGTTPILVTPATFEFASATAAPTFGQQSESTATKGADLTLTPQQSTHATDQGGGILTVNLETPTGAGAESRVVINRGGTESASLGPYPGGGSSNSCLWLQPGITPSSSNWTAVSSTSLLQIFAPSGGTTSFGVQGSGGLETLGASSLTITVPLGGTSTTPFAWLTTVSAIACGTGGTQTISAAQAGTPGLNVTSGTLSSNCILDFSTNASTGWYQLDMTGVTLGATFGVQFKNGTTSSTVITSSNVLAGQTLATVWTHGTNKMAVSY